MQIADWRTASAAEVSSLLELERCRWLTSLGWDPAEAWALVERARDTGTLPGFVARGDGRIIGWTFFLVSDGVLKIGALEGESAEVIRTLLEEVLDAPETRFAAEYQCFLFPTHPSVEAALARRRFAVTRHAYLERVVGPPTGEPDVGGMGLRSWRPSDLPGLVRLFARAYEGDELARCFAPHHRLDEWAGYLSQVVHGPALGRFEPACSWVSTAGCLAHPHGSLLATWVAPETLHVVQVAVDPDAQGHGLGARLMDATIRAAANQGAGRVTLLVAGSNAPALSLYTKLRFSQRATFLFGWRERPTRVSRARMAARGASTLLEEAG